MRAVSTASHPLSGLRAGVMRFVARVGDAGRNRRIVHGLATLDDHLLRDIGLTRHDVHAALIEPAMTDGTLVLAEAARVGRRSQTVLARETQAWAPQRSAARRHA